MTEGQPAPPTKNERRGKILRLAADARSAPAAQQHKRRRAFINFGKIPFSFDEQVVIITVRFKYWIHFDITNLYSLPRKYKDSAMSLITVSEYSDAAIFS